MYFALLVNKQVSDTKDDHGELLTLNTVCLHTIGLHKIVLNDTLKKTRLHKFDKVPITHVYYFCYKPTYTVVVVI
jgi:hypothetical protein